MLDNRATSEAREDIRRQLRRSLECLVGVHFTEGNAITVLRNGDEIFPAMLQAIAAAKKTVTFETYIYWDGEIGRKFAEALSERAGLSADGAPDMRIKLFWPQECRTSPRA